MYLKAKRLSIATGYPRIVLITKKDAVRMELYSNDRVKVNIGRKSVVATVDISHSEDLVKQGEIGLFSEVYKKIGVRTGSYVDIELEPKPKSIQYIKKKVEGKRLSYSEFYTILEDISKGELTDIELSYFVCSCYINKLNISEIVSVTKAMINTGDILKLKSRKVIDIHCTGGVAGNRTTLIVVPILVAAGLTVPKTSSRAITSASGTADTLEVITKVSLTISEMKRVIKKVGGCMCWGGAVNLAPADDKIIRVEHPMSLDPTGQMIASILGKKKSVSATHALIEIPLGKDSKIDTMKRALELKRLFEIIAQRIGLKVKIIITDGSQPVGNGIGPCLEIKDVLWTLLNTTKSCPDLREKSLILAAECFELAGRAKKGRGYHLAKHILDSGKAYEVFCRIIKAQGGKVPNPDKIRIGRFSFTAMAAKNGKVIHISNHTINKIARFAGCPLDKEAGVYLHVHKGDVVKKGEPLLSAYSDNKERIKFARSNYKKLGGIVIK